MLQKIKNNPTLKLLLEVRNLALYVLVIITLSVTWSSIKVIQKNYEIQKDITLLQQQVDVLDQQTVNQKLKNEYFKTDAFLELAARKYFGKALPGEKFISVPTEVAQKFVHADASTNASSTANKTKSKIIQNWQDWINFFLHRNQ